MQHNKISAYYSTRPSSLRRPHLVSELLCVMALICCFIAPHAVRAAAGDLDLRFGSGGVVRTDFSGGDDYGFGVKVQADGKTVVAGQSGIYPLFHSALIRYRVQFDL
jgi:hypothetical protein